MVLLNFSSFIDLNITFLFKIITFVPPQFILHEVIPVWLVLKTCT